MMTPRALLQRHVNDILGFLPGVYDGDVDSVHRVRVATRRLREVLPLAIPSPDSRLMDVARAAGRQLGRVRELDVMRGMLEGLAERDIGAAGIAAVARRALRDRQLAERRAMVKALESLDLDKLRRDAGIDGHAWTQWVSLPSIGLATPAWRSALRERLMARSSDAADAVRRATGIYLPNRAHRARVAIKKLRYAVEVAHETGLWRPRRAVKDLARLQSTLGAMHDAQVLIEAMDDLLGADVPAPGAATLKRLLDDDIVRHHADYLRQRDRVFAIGDACQKALRSRRFRPSPTLVAASVVAPLLILGRRQAS
jgi:CHAD domain-containing protein